MATGDVHKVQIHFSDANTGRTLTTGYYLREESGGDPSPSQVGSKVKAWWNDTQGALTPVKAEYNDDISLTQVTMRKWSPISAEINSYTTGLPIVGSGLGEAEAPQDCVLLSLRTALSGKRYRGRMYLPNPREAVTFDGLMNDANAQLFASKMLELFQLHLSVDAMQAVVFSSPGVPAPVTITPITTVKCDRRLRTQRRRQPRGTVYMTGV